MSVRPTAAEGSAEGFGVSGTAGLNPQQRAVDIESLAGTDFDVAVIGGGITGAGTALDAASRGLRTVLVEAGDLADGTSSKSSKLMHGGVRYLEMLDFTLVREALRERELHLTKLAPHLVKPMGFVWPLTHKYWERPYVGAGLTLYDYMGGKKVVPRHQHLSSAEMLRRMPGMDPAANVGGMRLYDSVSDDSRLVMTVARTARSFGAAILCGMPVERLISRNGRVEGLVARDRTTGITHTIRAKRVISAAGVWNGDLPTWLDDEATALTIRPSKGIHIVVPAEAIDMECGVLMRTEKSVLFIIPWLGRWLIGDTDTDWTQDKSTPVATAGDVDYLLDKVNSVLARKLSRSDVLGVIAGLRPLVQTKPEADTTKLSREHSVRSPLKGLFVIAGGKLTTYRVMARDVVNEAIAEDGPDHGYFASFAPNHTDSIPLFGAEGFERAVEQATRPGAELDQVDDCAVQHLSDRYGSAVGDLASLIAEQPELGASIENYAPYLWVEIAYACLAEGAMTLRDVLERRTRIAILFSDGGEAIAEDVARLMARYLGWTEATIAEQVEAYLTWLKAERAAMEQTDDAAAVAAYSLLMKQLPDPYRITH